MPTAKQDKTRKNGLTVKRFDCHGRFRCAIDGLLYDRGRIICCHSDSYFLFSIGAALLPGPVFLLFLQKCQSVGD